MSRPTARETNTAVFMLRAIQIGLSIADLEELDIGFVFDLMIESENDNYKYPYKAEQSDIDSLLG